MDRLRIATRGSKLALWQAEHIKAELQGRHQGLDVDLVVIKTTGDKILDVPLSKVGGKGLFTKEIEEALLDGSADIAVHSMKDVPVELPPGLAVDVFPRRADPTDTLVSQRFDGLDALPRGARVGTSSLRRRALLLSMRPDLEILDLRGNVDTRLRKLAEGRYDAIVMATAAIHRLGLSAPYMAALPPMDFLPAVAQGALGIEHAPARSEVGELIGFLNHPETVVTVAAERGFLTGLDGGCQVPIAAHAVLTGDTVRLTGFVADVDGTGAIRKEAVGPADQAFDMGLTLAAQALDAGARDILDRVYGQD